ncbi:MAG TPA: helix-turn-helix transcriptional regulator [Candidatus Rhabdochlamydia sp.]|jgi:transcriptional regulator with XRE-family HTH domain|nr:helix-turn-helix transcriptional regulator [Candidatus Rhabdochlamydia sp.]
MTVLFMATPWEVQKHLAKQVKEKRLSLNLSQQTLSNRSGVSFGVLKKFEQTGKISLESLLKIALVLESLEGFKDLFKQTKLERLTSIDELIKSKKRKRGRK